MFILKMVVKMHIEILLKQIREEKNVTIKKLAEKSGVSKTHISDIEKNFKMPSLIVMVKIAKALDVNITDLYKVMW